MCLFSGYFPRPGTNGRCLLGDSSESLSPCLVFSLLFGSSSEYCCRTNHQTVQETTKRTPTGSQRGSLYLEARERRLYYRARPTNSEPLETSTASSPPPLHLPPAVSAITAKTEAAAAETAGYGVRTPLGEVTGVSTLFIGVTEGLQNGDKGERDNICSKSETQGLAYLEEAGVASCARPCGG